MEFARNGLLRWQSLDLLPPGFHPLEVGTKTTTACLGPFTVDIHEMIDPLHKLLKVPKITACPKGGQVGAYIVGPVAAPPLVMRTCACNAVYAAAKRHLAVRQAPTPHMLAKMEEQVDAIKFKLADAYRNHRANMSWDQWIHRWPAWKQAAILHSVLHEDIEAPAIVTAMVKREVLVGLKPSCGCLECTTDNPPSKGLELVDTLEHATSGTILKEPNKARLIHFYRYLATQERHALRYYAYQKAVGDVFDGSEALGDDDIRITVASSMNQSDKGRWFDDAVAWAGPDIHILERDGASWDATMGKDHMDLQQRGMEGFEPDFLEFVDATRKCKVTFRHTGAKRASLDFLEKFVYEMDHTTKSGHNDTSSRNGFINGIVTKTSLRECGIFEARVLVVGDDLMCVLKRMLALEKLLRTETDCGIKPVAAIFGPEDISRVEFASDAFAPAVGGYIAIPKLGKLFAKLNSTTTNVRGKDSAAFAHSIAVGLQKLVLDAPLYGDLLRCSLDESGETEVIKTHRWERHTDERVRYGPEFRVWLFDRYGLTETEITALSTYLQSCKGPGYMKHYLIDRIMGVDLADPAERLGRHCC